MSWTATQTRSELRLWLDLNWLVFGASAHHRYLADAIANWVELVSFGSIGIMLLSDLVSCQTWCARSACPSIR